MSLSVNVEPKKAPANTCMVNPHSLSLNKSHVDRLLLIAVNYYWEEMFPEEM